MTVPARTAEWICTRCGTSNRKLVSADTTRTVDRCAHCKTSHVVEPDVRPVRWRAAVAD